MIDASGSVRSSNPRDLSRDHWQLQLDFLADLMSGFTVGPDDTRVGAVVFSNEALLAFPLSRYTDLWDVQESIRRLAYMGGTTNTPLALTVADTQCFNDANGDRDDAENVLIMMTDGVPFPRVGFSHSMRESQRLGDANIRIIPIGVNNIVDIDEGFLQGLATGGRYIITQSFTQLQEIKQPVLELVCDTGEYNNLKTCLRLFCDKFSNWAQYRFCSKTIAEG